MDRFAGLTPTGREIKAPAARLLELEDAAGIRHTAIEYDEPYHDLPELNLNVELILSFLQYPMVVGLVELSHHDLPSATFVYPTGPVWTLKEVLRSYQDAGQVVGLRAGLELAYLGTQVLKEASETGPIQGCFSHGALNPWRISLRSDGQVQIIGYGLPQVELLSHRRDPEWPIPGDSLRYCPPERLEGMPEDLAADTYSLTLIAYEVITGKPLYDGHDLEALEKMVALSEGTTLLSRARTGLPKQVANVFARCLIFDPDTRLSGDALLGELEGLLRSGPDGPSLQEVVERVQGTRKKRGKKRAAKLVSTGTEAYTPEQLRALAEDDEDDEDDEDSADDPRWSQPSRGKSSDEATDDGDTTEADDAQPRRRRRRTEAADEATPEPAPRRRRRRSKTQETDAAPEEPARRRRRRRTSSGAEDVESSSAEDESSTTEDESSDSREEEGAATEAEAAESKATLRSSRRGRSGSGSAKSSRRRRSSAAATDDATLDEAHDADKKKPSRRRRSSSGKPKKSSRRRRKSTPDDD